MTDRELMQMALDALEAHADIGIKAAKQIEALRARLAQPDLAQVGEVGVWGQREWKGLTDEEYTTIMQQADHDAAKTGSVFQNLRHAIEAKLKEKNT